MNSYFLFCSSLQTAESGLYKDIYSKILTDSSNIVQNGDDGFVKVRTENYAFIDDATYLAMNASDNCNLALIKDRFYKTGFGIAVPQGWPYKKYFDAV